MCLTASHIFVSSVSTGFSLISIEVYLLVPWVKIKTCSVLDSKVWGSSDLVAGPTEKQKSNSLLTYNSKIT